LENNVLYLKNASINNLKVHMIRESFWVRKEKFTKYERKFQKIHVHFGFKPIFLCSKERRNFLSKNSKIHKIWTIIHEDFRSILVRGINFDYKWKKEVFELERKNSRNLNEYSRRFTFNLVSKKYFCVQKKEENFWGKKTKITKYERLFTKNHAHARPIEVYTVVESFKTTF
jgi:hypothetical protein